MTESCATCANTTCDPITCSGWRMREVFASLTEAAQYVDQIGHESGYHASRREDGVYVLKLLGGGK